MAYCLRCLELAVAGAVPADSDQPVPVPTGAPAGVFPGAPPVVGDPTPWLPRLAAEHAGRAVSAYLDVAGCRLYLHERGGARRITPPPPGGTRVDTGRVEPNS